MHPLLFEEKQSCSYRLEKVNTAEDDFKASLYHKAQLTSCYSFP